MSKPAAAATLEKIPAAKAPPEKEEADEEENESSKEETNDATTPTQSTSPSVTVSSIHQYPSLPTVPSTPTLNNSPAAPLPPTIIASVAPDEISTPVNTPPKLAEFRPPIITADENEQSSSNVKEFSPKPADKKMSSLKVIKNVPGKPKESIFETKHPNLHAVDKGYLQKLIETKEKYDQLSDAHAYCITEDQQKEREKEFKEREREKYKKKVTLARRLANRDERALRRDKVRGTCWMDSLEEEDRYGPKDPISYTLRRMQTMNPKLIKHCKEVIKLETEDADVPIKIGNYNITPSKFIEEHGQKWLVICPMFGRISKGCQKTEFHIINLTERVLELYVEMSGANNFLIEPDLKVMDPLSISKVTISFLKKRKMDRLHEKFTIFFNDFNDLKRMRKDFGSSKIDITKHYAGIMSVGLFTDNYQLEFEQKRGKVNPCGVSAGLRAKNYLKEAKRLLRRPKITDFINESQIEEKKADFRRQRLERKEEERRERQMAQKEKEKKEQEEKEKKEKEKEKKPDQKRPGIKANNKTSVDIDDKVSASVSRETSKDRGKGTEKKTGTKKDPKYSEEKPSPSVSRDVEDGKKRK